MGRHRDRDRGRGRLAPGLLRLAPGAVLLAAFAASVAPPRAEAASCWRVGLRNTTCTTDLTVTVPSGATPGDVALVAALAGGSAGHPTGGTVTFVVAPPSGAPARRLRATVGADGTASATLAAAVVGRYLVTVGYSGHASGRTTFLPAGPAVAHLDVAASADGGSGSGGTETPELDSGELLATGLVPLIGLLLYRRRGR